MDLDALTAELFQHFTNQDFHGVREMFTPDAKVKQNGNPEHGVEGLITMIKGLQRDGVRVEYSDVRRSVGDHFALEQHVVRLTRADGVSAACDVCFVVRFDPSGLISRLDEYVDTTAFASLLG
jgi:ketosteroid isomerase-like protein